jgi:hypothetical protein
MLKNITLSAEERLIKAARTRAQKERTTLNNLFRDWLVRYTGHEQASSEFRRLMRDLKHINSGRKFSREEMNAR